MREGKLGPLYDPAAEGGDGGNGADGERSGEDNPLKEFLNEDGELVVTVNGEEKVLGPSELQAELQKGLSGDARLREAAQAEGQVQYAADVEAALDDDVDAYFRVAEARGVSEEDAEAILEHYEQGGDEEEGGEKEAESEFNDGGDSAPAQVTYVERQPSAEEQKSLEWAHAKQLQEVREWIHGDLDEGLDTDPRFATLMRAGGKRADQVRDMARNAVKRIVVSEQIDYTPTIRGRVLDELGHVLETFGGGTLLPPGAGAAPFSGAPEFTQAPRISKRPDIDSPDYEKWVSGELEKVQIEALLADE